jgi:hypothetical protein
MKFKGQICTYCQERLSTTDDHLFSRQFFLVRYRDNLPQVGACGECNNRKSKLELYLTAVLPFGGSHPAATETLQSLVPPRLEKNRKLHKRLNAGKTISWRQNKAGIMVPQTELPFDYETLEDLLVYITMGLLWHHWQVRLQADYFVSIYGDERAARIMRAYAAKSSVKQSVEIDLGDGVFGYQGMQAKDNDGVSLWRFSVFGGLTLRDAMGRDIDEFWAITGPRRILENVERHCKGEGSMLIGESLPDRRRSRVSQR